MNEYLIVIIRAVLIVLVLFVCTKLLGKKQISQLSFFEYVTGITIGSIGAEVITGLDRNFYHGVLGILAFIAIPLLADFGSLKSKKLRDLIEGEGTVMIQRGEIIEKNLKKERYTSDELLELLRKKEVFEVSDVEFAILEPSGDLNVLLKDEAKPLTKKDVFGTQPQSGEPVVLIMDGKPMDKALQSIEKTREWMTEELAKRRLLMKDVFLAQMNGDGRMYFDLYDHQEKN
ncbi:MULTISPECIES: DUF421 domain-containing protein [Jeotgalibacillus]|uniref:DUF421 domain-containing protein n=1 Tax=Jeotgalibacillus TaxID=157226 RepID=UPI001069D53F|nr:MULTISPECIES: DUF421 domain-containing protein [Jeotgalibacillus]TFE01207.1 DUF421 domain-containing protein [Jeotgalibacillus sp. R-1-5s-1]